MTQQEALKKFMKHWGSKRTKSYEFRQQYNPQMAELDRFIRGEQWNATNRPVWLNTPVTNFLHPIKNSKVASITETDIDIRIKPLAKDDIAAVEGLEEIIQSFWDVKGMHTKLINVKESSRIFPMGFLQVSFDTSKVVGTKNNLRKGDFDFESVPPTDMYWDPKAYTEEKMEYMYRTHVVTLRDIKNTAGYNQEVVEDISDWYDTYLQSEEAGEVLDRNYSLQEQDRTFILYEISFRWKTSPGADYKYGTIHTVSNGQVDTIDKDGYKGKKGDSSIEMTPLYFKADLGTKMHYFIGLKEFNQTHEYMGKSTVQLVLDNQKQINKIDSIISNIATQAQNVQKIVAADSGIDPKMLAKYGNAPGVVLVTKGDINNSVKYMDTAKLPADVLALRNNIKEDMKEVGNMSNAATGKGTHSLNSSQGVSTLVNQSNALEVTPQGLYEEFLSKIVKLMSQYLVKNHAKIERRLDITNPDSEIEYEFKELDLSSLKDKEFDISVNVLLTAQQKAIQKQEAFRIYELQVQSGKDIITTPTLIKMLGFNDEDRILASYYAMNGNEAEAKALKVAQAAAAKLAQTLLQEEDVADIPLEQAVQVAATEAVQAEFGSKESRNLPPEQQQPQQAQAPQPSGTNAPQPAQQAALEGGQ